MWCHFVHCLFDKERFFYLYYDETRLSNGRIISCDNVRIKFAVEPSFRDNFERLFADNSRIDITRYPINLADFKYKYLFTVNYGESSMTVGYIFNGSESSDVRLGYLDFNPNKIARSSRFRADLEYIKACCPITWEIARVDVAIDIPSKRECVYLVKDNRVYQLKAYSHSNKTEYLGLRSHVGFVKLYNKTAESKLDYDLTRLEITCEPNLASFLMSFPEVYDLSADTQFDTDLLSLSDTDLAIVRMCLEVVTSGRDPGLMIFNSLGRRKKQKLKKFILPESCLVGVDVSVLSHLFDRVTALYG